MILDQSNIQYPNKRIQLVYQFSDISEQSYSHFELRTSSILIKRSSQSLQSLSPSQLISQQLISKFILQGSYQSALMALVSNLTNFNTIDFYTNGFLSNDDTIHMIIDIG